MLRDHRGQFDVSKGAHITAQTDPEITDRPAPAMTPAQALYALPDLSRADFHRAQVATNESYVSKYD